MKLVVPIVDRTNYSKLSPVLLHLKDELDILVLISSGMATERIGDAKFNVISDGFQVEEIDCLMMNDSLESLAKTSGMSLILHSSIYNRFKPDGLLAVGDRFDMVPPVWASRLMNMPIFHIQGGEKSGSIDNIARNIITICADRHYASTYQAYKNVCHIVGGEEGVLFTGCPAVEHIQNIDVGEFIDTSSFIKHYKDSFNIYPNDKYFVVMVHPNTLDEHDVDMDVLLESVNSFKMKAVLIYPNIDTHYSLILKSISKFHNSLVCVKHMPLCDFVKIMAHASCFVGNSSCCIRETASFGVPTVIVGNRQQGRETNENTIRCSKGKNDIMSSIGKSLKHEKYPRDNIYFKHGSALAISKDVISHI